ncbi:uncharacterized protein LOC108116748 [Drosophila eugracilis]|uniref:uncharacterized protein LOC108116748 n=1 Tax=Drosophila eugracilis TaxID=29029 RepID=UPI0007E87037|nr:uncharacterized protein LOC108116748 [Drosophila eugracilis]
MICMPALNLFLYNGLLVYIAREVKRVVSAPSSNISGWRRIPIIGRVFAPQQANPAEDVTDSPEFSDFLWCVNLYVNFLLLLPVFLKVHNFSLLVAMVLMWNFYVYQRLFAFYLRLVWHLWWSDLCWAYYAPLAILGFLMSSMHLGLIVGTMNLQTKRPEVSLRQSLPLSEYPSPELPLHRAESVESIGDGPKH